MSSTHLPLTRSLGQFIADLSPNRLPEEAARVARMGFIDTIGTMIAGRQEDSVRIMTETLAPGDGPATLTFGDRHAPAPEAAWINGTAAHALDYDDVNMAMPGHPSVAVLPAVLALGESRGASGAAVLAAFVAGYETACRIGRAIAPGHYDGIGFHATGTVGTFGAAAGCAHLLGLSAEQTAHALGIAATQAAGLKSMFGTHCKPLHAGKAAYHGLLAARLAARGFTARLDALECVQGFCPTHSPDFHPDAALADPEGGWHIRNNLFKYHAACYLTHAGIEAARSLRTRHNLTADRIAAVTLRVDAVTDRVCNIAAPQTGLEAKFSHRLTAAMALAGHDTGRLDQYSAATATDPALVALRDRVVVELQPNFGSTRAQMDVRMVDQTTVSAAYDSGIPAPGIAAQGRRIEEKFLSVATPVLANAAALRDAVAAMDGLKSVASLAPLWATPATSRAA